MHDGCLIKDILEDIGYLLSLDDFCRARATCRTWRWALGCTRTHHELVASSSVHILQRLAAILPKLCYFGVVVASEAQRAALRPFLELLGQVYPATSSLRLRYLPVSVFAHCTVHHQLDCTAIAALTQLRSLKVEGALLTPESHVQALAALTRLTSLQVAASEYVQSPVVRGLLAAAAELRGLQELSLPAYSGLDAAGLAQLARLTGLGSLTLEQVYVEQSDALCALVAVLGSLAALTRLDLSADGNFGMNRCLRKAREHLPHLACLGLALTAFNDSPTISSSLAALRGQLTRLVLGVKDYRGGEALQLSELTGLSRLEHFGLRNGYGWCAVPVSVDLVAGLAAGWAQLACLQLQLAAGDLREGGAAGLAQLARFKQLRELSLGVGVEGAAPPGVALQVYMEQLPEQLEVLRLAHCALRYRDRPAPATPTTSPHPPAASTSTSGPHNLHTLALSAVCISACDLLRATATNSATLTSLVLHELPLELSSLAPALAAARCLHSLVLHSSAYEPHSLLRSSAFRWLAQLPDLRELVLYVRGLVSLSLDARSEVEGALQGSGRLRQVEFVVGDVARWL